MVDALIFLLLILKVRHKKQNKLNLIKKLLHSIVVLMKTNSSKKWMHGNLEFVETHSHTKEKMELKVAIPTVLTS